MTKAAVKGKSPQGAERRRAKRTEILSTFSLYVTVPQKGPYRLPVYDVSELGVGFDIDLEEEEGAISFPIAVGDELDLHLYLNQSLYLPLKVVIRRIEATKTGVRRTGAEFTCQGMPGHMALLAFLSMLEAVAKGGVTA